VVILMKDYRMYAGWVNDKALFKKINVFQALYYAWIKKKLVLHKDSLDINKVRKKCGDIDE